MRGFRNNNKWLRITLGIVMSFIVAVSFRPLSFVFAEDGSDDNSAAVTEVNITNEEEAASEDAGSGNTDTLENQIGGQLIVQKMPKTGQVKLQRNQPHQMSP